MTKDEGIVEVKLPAVEDYPATLRLDPFPQPLTESPAQPPEVDILLNGTSIRRMRLQWTPGRVGAYDIVLPRANVRRGSNRVTVRVIDGHAVALWYLRVHPPVATASGR